MGRRISEIVIEIYIATSHITEVACVEISVKLPLQTLSEIVDSS